MNIESLDFDLPQMLLATEPAQPRDAARLMVCDRRSGQVAHHQVRDLPQLGLMREGDLMIANQARVLPAFFGATRTATGGKVSGLFLLADGMPGPGAPWPVMIESRGRLSCGETLAFCDGATMTLLEKGASGCWQVKLDCDGDPLDWLDRIGQTPLPPYIRRARRQQHQPQVRPEDQERYNTIFATDPGSVAAPTAGLHLTPALLEALDAHGVQQARVTLHIGTGTFMPIRSAAVEDHTMHQERFCVSSATLAALRRRQGRCWVIGTTSVRCLESLPPDWEQLKGDFTGATSLYIHPQADFTFRFTDGLLTNFHLPRSSLLAMVASLPQVGVERLMAWYREAIDHGYRFYSYGDAMLIV